MAPDSQTAILAGDHLDRALANGRRPLASIRTGEIHSLPVVLADLVGRVDLICGLVPSGKGNCGSPVGHSRKSGGPCRGTASPSAASRSAGSATRGDAVGSAVPDLFAGCFELLRPGGVLAVVSKGWRYRGRFLDVAGTMVSLARSVGFTYLQHVVALDATIRDSALVAHLTARERTAVRGAGRRGDPIHFHAHRDVSVFWKPPESEVAHDH
ncbi:MAG: hypothetical protein ACRDYE_00720 [Acidimicrobiales bacterium]